MVTDDIKQGGPYMSLLQFKDDVMPFTFADVLILRYLFNYADEDLTLEDFNLINETSNMNWSLRSQLKKFIKRFFDDPYRKEDNDWIKKKAKEHGISIKNKLRCLSKRV